jgi:hypothetical protein
VALVKYKGAYAAVNVAGKTVAWGNSIEVSAEVATSLLLETNDWEAGNKETEELLPTAPLETASVSGVGELLGARIATPPGAHQLDYRSGTNVLPVKIGVSASYSRVDATTRAEVDAMGPAGTDGPDGATVIRTSIKGASSSQVQISALVASAWQTGAYEGAGADATPVIGLARVSEGATGRAIAGYFESNREGVTAGGQQGLEIRVKNNSGVADSYVASAPSKSMGEWLNAGGNARSAVGYQIGHGFGQQFDVGYAVNVGAVFSAAFRDDSNSKITLDIHGEHEEAAIMLREKAGALVFNTAAGNFKLEQAAAVNNFMTGTAAGDGVILTGAKVIHIGAGAGRAMLRVGANLAIGSTAADSFGGGTGVVFGANASAVPSTNPSGGGVLYWEGGALKHRGSAGTITEIAKA